MRRLFIMRKDLHMSAGKLAAQVAHCAEAYWTRLIIENMAANNVSNTQTETSFPFSINTRILNEYVKDSFTKTICEAKNKTQLLKAVDLAKELGLVENRDYGLIYDMCLTELKPEESNGTTLTGIWFKPLPDDQAHFISHKFQLYKE